MKLISVLRWKKNRYNLLELFDLSGKGIWFYRENYKLAVKIFLNC